PPPGRGLPQARPRLPPALPGCDQDQPHRQVAAQRPRPAAPGHPFSRGGFPVKLADQLTDYVHAAFSGLWVLTHEPDEAEREIVQPARQQGWKVAVWDIANGLRLSGQAGSAGADGAGGDPLAALRALPALADPKGTALVLLHHFHR